MENEGSCREIFREPPQKRGPSLKISRHPLIFQQTHHLAAKAHFSLKFSLKFDDYITIFQACIHITQGSLETAF